MKKPHHVAESGCSRKKDDGSHEIFPRGLNIVWGNDPRYWSLDKSSQEGLATLIQVSWLDVSGVVEVSKGKKYKVSFEVKLKPDAFGWMGSPVLVMAKLGKSGQYTFSEMVLKHSDDFTIIPSDQSSVIVNVPEDAPERRIYFGLYEVWSGKWKGGLQIKKVYVDALP